MSEQNEVFRADLDLELIARAICKAMNINPDGYAHAHLFWATNLRFSGSALEGVPNWRAAEHVARAAIEAIAAIIARSR